MNKAPHPVDTALRSVGSVSRIKFCRALFNQTLAVAKLSPVMSAAKTRDNASPLLNPQFQPLFCAAIMTSSASAITNILSRTLSLPLKASQNSSVDEQFACEAPDEPG